MLLMAEIDRKRNRNHPCHDSVWQVFHDLARSEHRGWLGLAVNAAFLMFVESPADERAAWLRAVRDAELEGFRGSIADAAREIHREHRLRPSVPTASGQGLTTRLEVRDESDQASRADGTPPPGPPLERQRRAGIPGVRRGKPQ